MQFKCIHLACCHSQFFTFDLVNLKHWSKRLTLCFKVAQSFTSGKQYLKLRFCPSLKHFCCPHCLNLSCSVAIQRSLRIPLPSALYNSSAQQSFIKPRLSASRHYGLESPLHTVVQSHGGYCSSRLIQSLQPFISLLKVLNTPDLMTT